MTDKMTATLTIKKSYSLFSFPQAVVSPVIEIDGEKHKGPWGTQSFQVAPGKHVVKAYHRWFFFRQCHLSRTTLSVEPGERASLSWSTPMMVMSPGKWSRERS